MAWRRRTAIRFAASGRRRGARSGAGLAGAGGAPALSPPGRAFYQPDRWLAAVFLFTVSQPTACWKRCGCRPACHGPRPVRGTDACLGLWLTHQLAIGWRWPAIGANAWRHADCCILADRYCARLAVAGFSALLSRLANAADPVHLVWFPRDLRTVDHAWPPPVVPGRCCRCISPSLAWQADDAPPGNGALSKVTP